MIKITITQLKQLVKKNINCLAVKGTYNKVASVSVHLLAPAKYFIYVY